jgi:hypothetical protein
LINFSDSRSAVGQENQRGRNRRPRRYRARGNAPAAREIVAPVGEGGTAEGAEPGIVPSGPANVPVIAESLAAESTEVRVGGNRRLVDARIRQQLAVTQDRHEQKLRELMQTNAEIRAQQTPNNCVKREPQ